MKTRIITAIVAIALFVPVCWFSYTLVFPIAISILCAMGVFEMAKCLGFHKNLALGIPMYIVALALPVFRRFTDSNATFLSCALLALFAVLMYFLAYVMLRKNKDKISDIMTLYALFVYVVGCFSSIVLVRDLPNGQYKYLLIFIGAWVCDTFAYFVGKLFGKHKLIPEISPKKTIEGSVGGIVFTVIAFILYGFIVKRFFGYEMSYVMLGVLGLAVSVISQMGDLIASSIKRQYGIKDYGFIFPGHGGVLDRFDSVMLTAPVLYIGFIVF